jgi:hypothetical protein
MDTAGSMPETLPAYDKKNTHEKTDLIGVEIL